MTKSLYEPDLYKESAKNSFGVQSLKQKPEALRWWEPDCAVGPGCTGEEPTLINGFAQPTGDLELFAFRLNADGLIQTKGILDATGGANGGIAWVMPGSVAGETDLIPPTSANDTFALRVTTTGDEAGIVNATAYVDNLTGDVIIRWSSAGGSSWGVPDLMLSAGATQTPGDGHYPVPWADYITPHESEGPGNPFNINDAEGTLFSLAITDTGDPNPGNDRYVVTTKRDGWWASQMITGWDQVSSPGAAGHEIAGVMQRIYWSGGSVNHDPNEYRNSADWMIDGSYDGGNLVIDSFGFLDDTYLVTTIMPRYVPNNRTWLSTGIHRTGPLIERGLSGVMWSFWFIAADDFDFPPWTYGNVFD